MDIQETGTTRPAAGIFNRRFFAHNTLRVAEGRGAAVIYTAATLLSALLLAGTHTVFGAYPLALGYLAAVDRRVPFAFLGGLLGALLLGERGYAYAVAYVVLFFLRMFLSYPRGEGRYFPACREFFEEDAPLRAASACACGLFLAVYELIAGGLSATSLGFAGSMLLLPVAACLLYLGFFTADRSLLDCLTEERGTSTSRADWYLSLSLGALACSLARGLETAELFGVSIAGVLSAFFALLFPIKWGLLRGGAAALLASLGACLSGMGVAYIPAFCAMAAAAALLFRFGIGYALLGAVAAGGALAYLLTGTAAILSFLPEVGVCLALAWPLFRVLPQLRGAETVARAPAAAEGAVALRETGAGRERMERFADAFSSLAEVFSRLSDHAPHLGGGRVHGDRNESMERQWSMTAALLRDAAAREAQAARVDTAASRAALRVFEEMGARAREATVLGGRARMLVARGVRWEADHPEESALRARLEEVCGCRLSTPVISLRGGVCDMRYTAVGRLRITPYTAGVARGQEVSGDAFSTFEGEGERFFALLSDGMGSGREAAITAGICGAFLSGVLGAGVGKRTAVSALNDLLAEREGECTATVDLCEIDRLSGDCCFFKCGAAASYVRRGESLFHIPAGRLPVGVLREIDVEKTRFPLQAGDCVILLSDGVSQTPEDALWLCELLSDGWEDDLSLMAERILHAARAHAVQSDDMTVALLSVEAA